MIRILLSTRLGISIHALREEGDAGVFSQIVDLGVFLSTPFVRRATVSASNVTFRFLSTPSARRATAFRFGQDDVVGISIHALREEGDYRW